MGDFMDKYLDLFYQHTNIKPLSISYIPLGITNNNYLVKCEKKDYVLRIPKDDMIGIDRVNENNVIELLKPLKIDVPTIYFDKKTGIKITEKIKIRKTAINYLNDEYLKKFLNQLKKIHEQKTIEKIADFDCFNLLKKYKEQLNEETLIFPKEEEIIEKTKKIYQTYPKVLCHNDLLFNNILYTQKKVFIIDYEYSGKNIVLFDLMSFVKENNIEDLAIQSKILKFYYGKVDYKIFNDFTTMGLFLDILWSYWAYMMYVKYKDKQYLDIAIYKRNRYLKSINHN